MMNILTSDILMILSSILAIFAIIYTLAYNIISNPVVEVFPADDKITEGDIINRRKWYHLKARVKSPPLPKLFRREPAIMCRVKVDFLDNEGFEKGEKIEKIRLTDQIEAHWTRQPEPVAFGRFQHSLIPMACERTVGFSEEMFDILIKYQDDEGFYAANPWIVYRFPKDHPEYQKLKVSAKECIVKVTIEAINLNKSYEYKFILKNKGPKMGDIEILPYKGKN